MPAVQQREEVGLAVTACGDQLAIDDAVASSSSTGAMARMSSAMLR
jgi:hypothetical protein